MAPHATRPFENPTRMDLKESSGSAIAYSFFKKVKKRPTFFEKTIKKTSQGKPCEVPTFIQTYGQAMGEEKPEEELMGKRKSSPRLATTSKVMLLYLFMSNLNEDIHNEFKFYRRLFILLFFIL